jgi:hypothetical protein
MNTQEFCEALNSDRMTLMRHRPSSAVLFSEDGHRLQRTKDGFKPLNRSKEQARRARQMERAKADK